MAPSRVSQQGRLLVSDNGTSTIAYPYKYRMGDEHQSSLQEGVTIRGAGGYSRFLTSPSTIELIESVEMPEAARPAAPSH